MADQFTMVRFRRSALNRDDRFTHAVEELATTEGGSHIGAALCGVRPAPATGGWVVSIHGPVNCMACTTALIKCTVKHD